jgi:SPP1 family predicted phage head-tail adaptor
MHSSRLDKRITLQTKSVTRDAMGGEVITWTDEVSVWAAVEPLNGREYFSAEQMQSEIDIRFIIRYRSGVTSAWRVLWEDNPYNIVEPIDPNGDHIWLHLMTVTQHNG